METVQGLIKSPKGLLRKQTVNRWLSRWRLDQPRLLREPPAVRFQAENSNDCWQFDMSPSDLKHIERPDWVDPARGEPTLMLFSVVDDRSGVAYQEYRCVYGEDAESALRFLFNAMAPKTRSDFPFQGRPKLLYLDNGPVAKNHVFQNVMQSLKVDWLTHTPAGKDGPRTTARSKGKVERPFRTVKEAHETLYHFHKPETELQANEWLWNYLSRYNAQRHRSEKHSRLEDWLANIGQEGVRDMCSWEQYCRFAREPESRKVGVDARITIDGTAWEVEPDMAGETVILLWGLFDEEMYVEFTGETWGPYYPVSGPVPLHRYRTFRRGKAAERADRIHALARQLNIPISALSGSDLRVVSDDTQQRIDALPHQPFDTRKFEYHFPTVIAAKLAIADDLAIPLARMSDEDRAFIDSILTETLNRSEVLARIRDYFRSRQSGEDHAG
ncbi:IS481 family transposase [Salmonella enterica subsp. enterica serovar Enteritidis]|uniref:IS481 family transposase n=1 Tax=Salmonella enteritidis TaxID=149539 RepID=A0A6X9H9F3_SALEN|nr:IS481 family transposase [Salmonella enterica]EBR8256799.1 IS481 family transposase [Salmonella enterica subsp. enterica serovar Enteritidis]ELO53796.1 integrase, catalytic region [Salmonella enterica subsp. enterica serovar Enteritidis str. 561362 9-7]EBJ0800250.1 IS481 family transposase [Salmonella enterica]EBK4321444.1 IS481 family transposase [Salmonella enterica]